MEHTVKKNIVMEYFHQNLVATKNLMSTTAYHRSMDKKK